VKNLEKAIVIFVVLVGLLALTVFWTRNRKQHRETKTESTPGKTITETLDRTDTPSNIILLSIDTLRRDHLPFYGYGRNTAPNLKRLSDEGITFDNTVSAHTNTAPSHATMLTGLYAETHGILTNGGSLREDVPVLSEILREHGYHAAAFVSAYTLGKHTNLQRGFSPYNIKLYKRRRRPASKTYAAARPWILKRSRARQPFFLFLHFFDPHNPYDPPGEFGKMFRDNHERFDGVFPYRDRRKFRKSGSAELFQDLIARYDGEIAYADSEVGRLLEQLDNLDIADNTLLVFVSDHGETLLERKWIFDHGCRVYDEQIMVPMVIRFPDKSDAGKRIKTQVGLVDLMPTILDALHIPLPGRLAGRSLLPLLEREDSTGDSRPAFSNARLDRRRLGHIKQKLTKKRVLISSIRLPTFKLIEYPTRGGGWYQELFDLETDPGETKNISKKKPEVAAQLQSQLEAWRKETRLSDTAEPIDLSPEVEAALRELGYVH
jgi:arylsulfatase A-like enzyme